MKPNTHIKNSLACFCDQIVKSQSIINERYKIYQDTIKESNKVVSDILTSIGLKKNKLYRLKRVDELTPDLDSGVLSYVEYRIFHKFHCNESQLYLQTKNQPERNIAIFSILMFDMIEADMHELGIDGYLIYDGEISVQLGISIREGVILDIMRDDVFDDIKYYEDRSTMNIYSDGDGTRVGISEMFLLTEKDITEYNIDKSKLDTIQNKEMEDVFIYDKGACGEMVYEYNIMDYIKELDIAMEREIYSEKNA